MGTIISFKCGCCEKEKKSIPNEVFLLDKKNKYETFNQKATKAHIGEKLICAGCAPIIKKTDLRLITHTIKDMWSVIYRVNGMLDKHDGRRRSEYYCCVCREELPLSSGPGRSLDEDKCFRVRKSEDSKYAQLNIFYAIILDPDAQNICEECSQLFNTALLSTKSLTQIRDEAFGRTVAPLKEKLRLSDKRLAKEKEEKGRKKAEQKEKRQKINNQCVSFVNNLGTVPASS